MKSPSSFFLQILLFFAFTIASGQEQLTNVVIADGDDSSFPQDFVEFNNHLYFVAKTGTAGAELWKTDGTGGNTILLKDIFIGSRNGVNFVFKETSAVLNNKLFFVAEDAEYGSQIWATDGTSTGTQRVTNLTNANIKRLTLVGNQIFFLSFRNNRLDVWKTDGTLENTILVKGDLPSFNSPSFEGTVNGLFFFTFQPEGSNNSRVWRSDGSSDGTFPITEEIDGNGVAPGGTSGLSQYKVFNNELYFIARSGFYFSAFGRVGIMKTDGSIENTVAVKELYAGNQLTDFGDVIEINNKLYFSFFWLNGNRQSIWESDGSEAGTQLIYNISNSKYFAPSDLSSHNGSLIFSGPNVNFNTTLLKMELSSYSVEEIKELVTDLDVPFLFGSRDVIQIENLNDINYFLLVPSDTFPAKAWKSDITTANTTEVTALDNTRELYLFNERVYFASGTASSGKELWSSDLEFNNLTLTANINTSGFGFNFYRPLTLNNTVYYVGNDESAGQELWGYNNATSSSTLLKDIVEGPNSSRPWELTAIGDYVYFVATTASFKAEIWRSDGTESGTVMMSDGINGTLYPFARNLISYKNELYFFTAINNHYHLIRLNESGAESIVDLGTNVYGVAIQDVDVVASESYIYFSTEAEGGDLWRSDGTTSGTFKIKDLLEIKNLTAVGGDVFFAGQEVYLGEFELWKSDGSANGTNLVENIGGSSSAHPQNLVAYENKLIFTAFEPEAGREFWVSDGTADGTNRILDIYNGPNGSSTSQVNYGIFNGTLYFAATDGIHGNELWQTDGTGSGTFMVKDINEGMEGSFPNEFGSGNSRLFFSAFTEENGIELWSSKGADLNTELQFDLRSGSEYAAPTNLMFIEDTLFFLAETESNGRQLWRYFPIPDADGDGVSDSFDKCPNTPQGTVVDSDGCEIFSLPSNNFMVLVTDESCRSSNNGSIEIRAEKELNYLARLAGQSLDETKSFNSSILFDDLAAGSYVVCISVEGQNNYERCFELNISEPAELSVSSKIDVLNKTISLSLIGGKQYTISLNGKRYQTSKNLITLSLDYQQNKLIVSTDKLCQGTYEESIFLESELRIYPNPISSGNLEISVSKIDQPSKPVEVFVYNSSGQRILQKVFNPTISPINLSVDNLTAGLYFLVVETEERKFVKKLLKR